MKTLRVVVASPSDVSEERSAVNRAVDELNGSTAADRGILVQVAKWETDAFPGFHADGPQGLIDSVLGIKDADCLIGVFWKRFGTPTHEANSGTEQEIRTAVEAWQTSGRPHVMVYFSDRPYAPKSKAETDQWGKVLEFKEDFPTEGLWWSYGSPEEFEALVRKHLTKWLRQTTPQMEDGDSKPNAAEFLDRGAYEERYAALVDASNTEILIFTSKLHRSATLEVAQKINSALQAAAVRGVSIRVIVGNAYDRLPGGFELNNIGAGVRLDPDVPLTDANFACFDRQHVIIGGREATADTSTYKKSSAWVEFRSAYTCAILRREFERRWGAFGTRSLRMAARRLIPHAVEELGEAAVADQFGSDAGGLQRLSSIPPIIVALLGRPGSGKSSIATRLLEELNLAAPDLRVRHISDLPFIRKHFTPAEEATGRVERKEDKEWVVRDKEIWMEALEELGGAALAVHDAADVILLEFARGQYVEGLKRLSGLGIVPDVIAYVDVPFEIARQRNASRAADRTSHMVSEAEMVTTYATDDLDSLDGDERLHLLPNAAPRSQAVGSAAAALFDAIRSAIPAVKKRGA